MKFGHKIKFQLQRIRESLQYHGLGITVLKSYATLVDHSFDIKYGLDTCAISQLDELTINSDNKERGVLYVPTMLIPLRKLFHAIKPIFPDDSILVDFGCGKGRVLLVASEFGFREARGIDFAEELCETAKKNCSIYKTKSGFSTEFKIIGCDVINYQINPDENVFYLFNPFDETILLKVLCNIASSLQTKQREILIIYHNPLYTHSIEKSNNFVKLQELSFLGNKFIVYSNRH